MQHYCARLLFVFCASEHRSTNAPDSTLNAQPLLLFNAFGAGEYLITLFECITLANECVFTKSEYFWLK